MSEVGLPRGVLTVLLELRLDLWPATTPVASVVAQGGLRLQVLRGWIFQAAESPSAEMRDCAGRVRQWVWRLENRRECAPISFQTCCAVLLRLSRSNLVTHEVGRGNETDMGTGIERYREGIPARKHEPVLVREGEGHKWQVRRSF